VASAVGQKQAARLRHAYYAFLAAFAPFRRTLSGHPPALVASAHDSRERRLRMADGSPLGQGIIHPWDMQPRDGNLSVAAASGRCRHGGSDSQMTRKPTSYTTARR